MIISEALKPHESLSSFHSLIVMLRSPRTYSTYFYTIFFRFLRRIIVLAFILLGVHWQQLDVCLGQRLYSDFHCMSPTQSIRPPGLLTARCTGCTARLRELYGTVMESIHSVPLCDTKTYKDDNEGRVHRLKHNELSTIETRRPRGR